MLLKRATYNYGIIVRDIGLDDVDVRAVQVFGDFLVGASFVSNKTNHSVLGVG